MDGITWQEYEKDIDLNLKKLYEKIQNGAYRPKPARRVPIPKAGGSERLISIQCVEDKVVQQAFVFLLNKIYEIDFQGFSYGFRPGRNQHNALDALHVGLMSKKLNWVLDLDIVKYFDRVNHDWLIRFLQHRIKDKRVIRMIQKWLKVGYLDEKGRRITSRIGTPQGSVISPLLSNVYLHYVYDLWCKQWRKRCSTGDMIVIRYADDSVLAFQHQSDAKRFLTELENRMEHFGLELHREKTKFIRFGRFANARNKERGYGKSPTFEFLGFTHYCGTTRKSGKFMVWRKTSKKRMNKRLKELRIELMKRRHRPIQETAEWLKSILQGHYNYFGVPGNISSMSLFAYELNKAWYRSLC
ncbi:MAG: group II intron reverse transcriptase/maturase, partial [Halobacteriota archaeon]|nr:group II intron reverse transcriptase/maturase [Halobacteriota archaeon]